MMRKTWITARGILKWRIAYPKERTKEKGLVLLLIKILSANQRRRFRGGLLYVNIIRYRLSNLVVHAHWSGIYRLYYSGWI